MILEPGELGENDTQIFCAFRHFDASEFLHTERVSPIVRHRAKVVESIGVGHRPEITHVFAELFVIAMQIAEDGLELPHDLAFERDVHPEDAVCRRMLRPHRDFEQFSFKPRAHAHWRPLDCFECLNRRAHSNSTI